MKSANTGTATSNVEVLNVSTHGFWLLAGNREYFLSFDHFPWFKNATIGQLFNVELLHGEHLYWSALDVDLDLERIEHPENFPLVAKTGE
ncbi:MAG: DUF2442 domain-containing protein [Akkermansiaceae bacterium]|nr:DUF2442 domain-containing protein [Verrucomicrobiales bacterium]